MVNILALGLDGQQLLLQAVLLLGPASSHGPAKLTPIWFPCALVALSRLPKEDSFRVAPCNLMVYCAVCHGQLGKYACNPVDSCFCGNNIND